MDCVFCSRPVMSVSWFVTDNPQTFVVKHTDGTACRSDAADPRAAEMLTRLKVKPRGPGSK
jgi:hypothetical protein